MIQGKVEVQLRSFYAGHQMEVDRTRSLLRRPPPPGPIGQEAGWAPEPVER